MITPFRGTPVGLSTLTSTPTTHASTRAGDFLVLAVHGFWATSLGTGGITPPAGYTLIKRHDLGHRTGGTVNQQAALDALLTQLDGNN